MKSFNIKKYSIAGLLFVTLGAASCKKFVDLALPTNLVLAQNIFSDSSSLNAALGGPYSNLGGSNAAPANVFTYGSELADEYRTTRTSTFDIAAQDNLYTPDTDFGLFTMYYNVIYQANAILEGIDNAPAISATQAKQVKGECLFLRAFCYFNLTNFYGTPPLVLETDVNKTALLPNAPVESIYASIISDLKTATTLLSNTYPVATRTRVNLGAANALLAKAYLYHQEWANAAATADLVINSGVYTLNTDITKITSGTSNETLWQNWNANGFFNNTSTYIPSNTANTYYVVTPQLVGAFATNDLRRSWIGAYTGVSAGYYYPAKYKLRAVTAGQTEYPIQFRLAEVYLIRSEALAQQNKLPEATTDVMTIRTRAGLTTPLTVASQAELLDTIAAERRKELAFENANRWFDLKRTGKAVAVLSAIKPTFQPNALLLPFPRSVTNANPFLVPNP